MLEVEALTVRYGDTVAVDEVTLSAAEGEVLVVLGPSGCGKSTLLRAVAGLEPPTAGTIRLDGRDLAGVRPDQREVALAFQDHALFPHRSVAANVAFGPRMRGWSASATTERVREVLASVDLDGFEDRRVTELSGGEAQRVALARALAPRPRLLMLDEPLGSLDRDLRDRLLVELPRVFDASGATVLHVTHDQVEALTLADRVAVMRRGRLVQVDHPDTLWRHPVDLELARFLGQQQIVDGEVADGELRTPLGPLPGTVDVRGRVTVLLLAEAVTLDPGGPLAAVVTARRFAGDHHVLHICTSDGTALEVPTRGSRGPQVGDHVRLRIDPSEVRVFDPDGTARGSLAVR